MNRLRILMVLTFLAACTPTVDPVEQIAAQIAKVDSARTVVAEERARLTASRDSLDVRIAENIAIGMTREKAEAIERLRLETQENLLRVSESNLAAQEEYLALLRKVGRSE